MRAFARVIRDNVPIMTVSTIVQPKKTDQSKNGCHFCGACAADSADYREIAEDGRASAEAIVLFAMRRSNEIM